MQHESILCEPETGMQEPEFIDFTSIDLGIPPRSQLVGLVPHGQGTMEVESLFSYLVRLAAAHAVRFRDLVAFVVAPLVWDDSRKRSSSSLAKALPLTASRKCTEALEALTGRSNLAQLTLLPIQERLCLRVTHKIYRAWCPLCLGDDEEPYERLSWQIRGITHCSVHRCELADACSQCGRRQNHYNLGSSISACCYCKASLMTQTVSFPLEEKNPAVWRTRQIERLLKWASTEQPDIRSCADLFRANLETIAVPYGGLKPMGKELGLSNNTVFGWKSGRYIPELQAMSVLAWCNSLEVVDCFSRSLTSDEIKPRAGNLSVRARRPSRCLLNPVREKLTAGDLLTALTREIHRNPYRKIRFQSFVKSLGACRKSAVCRDKIFRQCFADHNNAVRRLRRRAKAWRTAIAVRTAVLKTVTAGQTLTRRNIGTNCSGENWMVWPVGRQMSDRMVALIEAGRKINDPSLRIPAEVHAFWAWHQH